MSVEELDSMKKFDNFLKLCDFYYVEQCENEDCYNCLFNINLRLFVQNKVHQQESVVPLQKVCKIKIQLCSPFSKNTGYYRKKKGTSRKRFPQYP